MKEKEINMENITGFSIDDDYIDSDNILSFIDGYNKSRQERQKYRDELDDDDFVLEVKDMYYEIKI
jgi:hypothetical protein